MAFEKEGKQVGRFEYLFGRDVLKSSLTEEELTPDNIVMVLKDVLPVHFYNRKQIDYLIGVYKGNQDILTKTKLIREDINNRVVENNAYHIVEFKKGYVFGDPIQYVQRGDIEKTEIEILNNFMINNDKSSKDKDLSEDMYVCGTGFRIILPNKRKDMPFEVYNINPKNANVVYSTGYDQKPLFAFYLTEKANYANKSIYYLITVYTKTNAYTFRTNENPFGVNVELDIQNVPELIPEKSVNWVGYIPIIEYPLNKSRLGLIELVKSTLDTLNKISSNDIDGIEQFIQSLLIFMNVDIDETQFKQMLEAGAIKLKSIDGGGNQVKSDIKSIVNQLQHSETKVLYDRLYNNMLTIAGVPRMSDKASSGDTGQARLVGEGWTMADERAKQDELSFKLSEKQLINIALKICKEKNTGIKTIEANDIDIKFTRNKSDNMLTKAETLGLLITSGVLPEIAMEVVGLFSDSSDVFKQSEAYHGADFWKKENIENTKTVAKPTE